MKDKCPLCAQFNQCDKVSSTCWCMKITLPKQVKDHLKSLDIDEGCVCNACLMQLADESKVIHK